MARATETDKTRIEAAKWLLGVAVAAFLGVWWGSEGMSAAKTNITLGVGALALGVAVFLATPAAVVPRLCLSVITVGLAGLISYFAAWKEEEPDRVASIEATLQTQQRQLQQLLEGTGPQASREKRLLAEYPKGYILFSLDSEMRVIPHESKVKDLVIDTKAVRATDRGDIVAIAIPRITHTVTSGLLEGNVVSVPKQQGSKSSFIHFEEVKMFVEVLASSPAGIVFVLGFK